MDEKQLTLDLFWNAAAPLAYAVVDIMSMRDQSSDIKAQIKLIKSLWLECKEYLYLRVPVIANDMAYAAAAWVDEMILTHNSGLLYLWQAAPLQLFWCGDLEAGIRFFDLCDFDDSTSLGIIKSWWFNLWLDLGFSGCAASEYASFKSRNSPLQYQSSANLMSGSSRVCLSLFVRYRKYLFYCAVAYAVLLVCLWLA